VTPPSDRSAPGKTDRDEDRALVGRAQAGDLAAFERLVEKYQARVHRLAYQVLRDKEEAWDCAQEAFTRAYQSLSAFRGQSAFYTWLFRITVNVATDRYRSRAARARAFGAESVPEEEWARTAADPGESPDQRAARVEQRRRIIDALDRLPAPARTIIMLSDIEGLSYREIADVLNCPIGTVMSRLHNARRRLRGVLGPLLALLLAIALAPGPAWAGDLVVRFGVRVLQATSAGPPVSGTGALRPPVTTPIAPDAEADERLRSILPRLRTLFRYTDYTTLDRHRAEGPIGSAQRFALPGSRMLEVVPDQLEGQAVRMRVLLLKGDQAELRASIRAAPGAPAVLGGPPHGDGVLIIILWANPNPTSR
jgi:RNA polymerase sigma-70 factor (ECF subfamily)